MLFFKYFGLLCEWRVLLGSSGVTNLLKLFDIYCRKKIYNIFEQKWPLKRFEKFFEYLIHPQEIRRNLGSIAYLVSPLDTLSLKKNERNENKIKWKIVKLIDFLYMKETTINKKFYCDRGRNRISPLMYRLFYHSTVSWLNSAI